MVIILEKVDATVKRETLYIAAAVGIMSMLMQAVFLIIRQWDYTVLCGNLLSAAAAVANFFLMGITVQKALGKDEKDAANAVRLSQQLRLLMMFVIVVLGMTLDCFNVFAVIIPLFFPRVAVAFRPLLDKKASPSSRETAEADSDENTSE